MLLNVNCYGWSLQFSAIYTIFWMQIIITSYLALIKKHTIQLCFFCFRCACGQCEEVAGQKEEENKCCHFYSAVLAFLEDGQEYNITWGSFCELSVKVSHVCLAKKTTTGDQKMLSFLSRCFSLSGRWTGVTMTLLSTTTCRFDSLGLDFDCALSQVSGTILLQACCS